MLHFLVTEPHEKLIKKFVTVAQGESLALLASTLGLLEAQFVLLCQTHQALCQRR